MTTIILVVHLLIAIALIGVVLLQRSEGGALGLAAAAPARFSPAVGSPMC